VGLNGATLNGLRATRARVMLNAWGCWHADASLDGEHAIDGAVTLKVADLTLKGTILSGGPAKGRSDYRIIAGAGRWGQSIPSDSYASDSGVKLTKVIGDAARLVGETFESSSTDRVGPAWTRPEGPASRVLELTRPGAWYVGEDGVTRLGARAAGTLPTKTTRIAPLDQARGTLAVASETIATILPGVVVDGLTAVDVEHTISADDGLRSMLWFSQGSGSRELAAFRKLLEQLDPARAFRGFHEYRITSRSSELLNLQPVLRSTSMPELRRVPVWPGVPGCSQTPPLGSHVAVGFLDGHPSRPFVAAFEDGAASSGLELITDGIGTGGHAVTLEQVLGLFAQYTAARFLLGDLGTVFGAAYSGAPPATLLTLIAAMITGAVTPAPIGPTPGATLDSLGLPALIAAAHLLQLPDPASLGLPTPVMPGLSKKNFRL
jgi:hypothetical protein